MHKITLLKTFCTALTCATISLTGATHAQAAESESGGWIHGDYDGVQLTYPGTFKKTAIGSQGGDDTILKVSGTTDNAGGWAELALSRAQGELSAPLRVKMIEESFLSKLPDYHGTEPKSVTFGGGQAGTVKESTFTHGGTKICQRMLIFGEKDKCYILAMTCPQSSQQSAERVWTTALSSLGVGNRQTRGAFGVTTRATSKTTGGSTAGSSTAKAEIPVSSATNNWRSKDGLLAMSYPAYLKEEVVEGDDHLFKASSAQSGKVIALDVHHGEKAPHQSTEELASTLEQKYFEPRKSYQKVSEESRAVGSSIPALVQESTFEAQGTKMHHMCAFISTDRDLWAISLSTAGYNANEAHQIWSRITSSITLRK